MIKSAALQKLAASLYPGIDNTLSGSTPGFATTADLGTAANGNIPHHEGVYLAEVGERPRGVEREGEGLSGLQRLGVPGLVVRRRSVWDRVVIHPGDGGPRRDGDIGRVESEILDAHRHVLALLRPCGGHEDQQGDNGEGDQVR